MTHDALARNGRRETRRRDAFTTARLGVVRGFGCCLPLLFGSGCGDNGQNSNVPEVRDDGGSPTLGQLAWTACDIRLESATLEGAAECAEVSVPARRAVSNSRVVTLQVKRFKRTNQPRAQLWLVAGGPGSAASDLELDADFYLGLGDDLEIYFLDHRGTGRSSRLACPAEEAATSASGELIAGNEWVTCAERQRAQWGDDLAGFCTTEAAADLGELIDRTRRDQQSVFVYAVSYGTYLAQRYLQLYPTQPTGVILDSICAPGKCDLLLEFDRQFETTARAIFDLCATDPQCSSELGSDPFAHVVDLSAALADGHCSRLGWTKRTLRQVLGTMVGIARLRDYMPAIVKRVERCNDADVTTLQTFQRYLSSMDTESNSFSQALYANIALGELSARPLPTAQSIADNIDGLLASMDAGARLAGAIGVWPVYPADGYVGKFADPEVPLLMLNGTLDPETPLSVAEPAGDTYRRAHQHFYAIPDSPHTTLTQSLVDDAGNTCGAILSRQFLENPEGDLDETCLSQTLPLNFAGYPGITELLLGTDAVWTDPSTATP